MELTIPVGNRQGFMVNVTVTADFPLSPGEWQHFQNVLEAMEPALVRYPEPVKFESAGLLSGGKITPLPLDADGDNE